MKDKETLFKNMELNRIQFKLPEGVFQAVKSFSETNYTDSNTTNFFLDFINYEIERLEKNGCSINVLGEELESNFKEKFLEYMIVAKEYDSETMYSIRYSQYANLVFLLKILISKKEDQLSEKDIDEFTYKIKEELRKLLELLYEDFELTGVEMRKLINLFLFNKVRLCNILWGILENEKIKKN